MVLLIMILVFIMPADIASYGCSTVVNVLITTVHLSGDDRRNSHIKGS